MAEKCSTFSTLVERNSIMDDSTKPKYSESIQGEKHNRPFSARYSCIVTLLRFQALLRESEESSSARRNSERSESLGTDGARNRRTHLGGPATAAPASADGNLRFIREEINKKCRRVYQAFITCYQKLP